MKRYAYLLLYWIVLPAVIAFLSGFVKQRSVRPDASANGSQVFPLMLPCGNAGWPWYNWS